MRWILLADVHANIEALDAVLRHASPWRDAAIVVAGDVVGYGPDPNACIEVLRERGALAVLGNHDAAVLGERLASPMAASTRACIEWTRQVLDGSARQWLAGLPRTLRAGRLFVCHGDGEDYERYVDSPERAMRALAELERSGAADRQVHGHTHRSGVFRRTGVHQDGSQELPAGEPCLVNPGPVGQALGEQPLARYARYDDGSDQLEMYAITYNHRAVLERQRRYGLTPAVTRPTRPPAQAAWRRTLSRALRALER